MIWKIADFKKSLKKGTRHFNELDRGGPKWIEVDRGQSVTGGVTGVFGGVLPAKRQDSPCFFRFASSILRAREKKEKKKTTVLRRFFRYYIRTWMSRQGGRHTRGTHSTASPSHAARLPSQARHEDSKQLSKKRGWDAVNRSKQSDARESNIRRPWLGG